MNNVSNQEAARRHLDDGLFLEQHSRLANAGQLYGFSAECALKFFLPFDMQTDAPRRPFKRHIHELSAMQEQIKLDLSGRIGAIYSNMLPDLSGFADWHTDHRYWTTTAIPPLLANWQYAARQMVIMLDHATTDGISQCL